MPCQPLPACCCVANPPCVTGEPAERIPALQGEPAPHSLRPPPALLSQGSPPLPAVASCLVPVCCLCVSLPSESTSSGRPCRGVTHSRTHTQGHQTNGSHGAGPGVSRVRVSASLCVSVGFADGSAHGWWPGPGPGRCRRRGLRPAILPPRGQRCIPWQRRWLKPGLGRGAPVGLPSGPGGHRGTPSATPICPALRSAPHGRSLASGTGRRDPLWWWCSTPTCSSLAWASWTPCTRLPAKACSRCEGPNGTRKAAGHEAAGPPGLLGPSLCPLRRRHGAGSPQRQRPIGYPKQRRTRLAGFPGPRRHKARSLPLSPFLPLLRGLPSRAPVLFAAYRWLQEHLLARSPHLMGRPAPLLLGRPLQRIEHDCVDPPRRCRAANLARQPAPQLSPTEKQRRPCAARVPSAALWPGTAGPRHQRRRSHLASACPPPDV